MDYRSDYIGKLEQIPPHSVIVTSTQRLAHFLSSALNTRPVPTHSNAICEAWMSPHIVCFDIWLTELWRDMPPLATSANDQRPMLLSSYQEAAIWENVISHWNNTQYVAGSAYTLNEARTAKAARSCWDMLSQYGCLPAALNIWGSYGLSHRTTPSLASALSALLPHSPQSRSISSTLADITEANALLDGEEFLRYLWNALGTEPTNTPPPNSLSLDHRSFVEWAAAFACECRQNAFLPQANLSTLLCSILECDAKAISTPEHIFLAGYDLTDLSDLQVLDAAALPQGPVPTPSEQAFMRALHRSGRVLKMLQPPASTFSCYMPVEATPDGTRASLAQANLAELCSPYPDFPTELRSAATWARQWLAEKPDSALAIIVPDLRSVRTYATHILDDVLCPDVILPEHWEAARPYNISLGTSLACHHLVSTALDLLAWCADALPLERVGPLLCAPCLTATGTDDKEKSLSCLAQHTELDLQLRRIGAFTPSMQTVVDCIDAKRRTIARAQAATTNAGAPEVSFCHHLRETLKKAIDRSKTLRCQSSPNVAENAGSVSRCPSEWADIFHSMLVDDLGWPGLIKSERVDYQYYQKFVQTLRILGSLDCVTPSMTWEQALSKLKVLCWSTVFEPRNPPAPLEIMGASEAPGQAFDGVWLCGFSNNSWPVTSATLSYLPNSLQRVLNMPGAQPSLHLNRMRRLTSSLLHLAPHTVISFSKIEFDSKNLEAQHPPQILKDVAPITLLYTSNTPVTEPGDYPVLPPAGDSWSTLIFTSGQREVVDDYAPPAIDPSQTVSGGCRILALQASCPFRACAELRLHAEPFPAVDHNATPQQRGSIAHAALQRIWTRLKTSEELHRLSQSELRQLIVDSVDSTITEFRRQNLNAWQPPLPGGDRFCALEKQFTTDLLFDWLETVEKQRQVPFAVSVLEGQDIASATEQPTNKCKEVMNIFGLQLRGIIDRIDILHPGQANAGQLIIDYKTGNKKPYDAWIGKHERPDDPQLPIYLVHKSQQESSAKVQGIAFALVGQALKGRPLKERLRGLARNVCDIEPQPKNKGLSLYPEDDWDGNIARWQRILSGLAQEYLSGVATVSPNTPQSCEYCELKCLCRKNASGVPTAQEDEDDCSQTEGE